MREDLKINDQFIENWLWGGGEGKRGGGGEDEEKGGLDEDVRGKCREEFWTE